MMPDISLPDYLTVSSTILKNNLLYILTYDIIICKLFLHLYFYFLCSVDLLAPVPTLL
jgi:hypothetical protein